MINYLKRMFGVGTYYEEVGSRTFWYLNDKLHREDGPAIERADGDKSWYLNGELHREDGPAIEWANGDKEWWMNGELHREDGPAIEWANGDKEWWMNGKLHREDGPAIEWANGYRAWWVNGERRDAYYPNFGCFYPKSREEALERLDRKWRPHSRDLYMRDIDEMFPEGDES